MKKKLSNYLILVLIIIFMIGIYIFFIMESKSYVACYAKAGVLNLEKWDWSKNKILELNGQWRFSPNILKEDLTEKSPYMFKEVPHFWETDSDQKFSPYGYGAYRLEIIGLKPRGIYAVQILDEVSAYTLYANNVRVAANGIVGNDAATYEPMLHPYTGVFQADERGKVEFVIEISNFDYYRGGFWNSLKIGDVNDILADANKTKSIDMFLFATIFVLGFFNFALFLIYRQDKTTLYFALFCFTISFRILLVGQRLITDMMPYLKRDVLVRAEFLMGYLLLPIFALFTIHLFETKAYSTIMKKFFYVLIFYSVIGVMLLPNSIYAAYLEPNKWGSVLFVLYFIFIVSRSIRKRKDGIELMIFAGLGFMVSIWQEIFIRSSVSWVPFASLNFVICFALITFQQFLNEIKKKEVLEDKVILDPLTGLYNRNFLINLDDNYFNKHEGKKKYLLFLDLDRFKYINDTFGHEIGDIVLQQTGQRLKKLLAERAIICRYGGDEFIVIVTTDGVEEIRNIAEKIIEVIVAPIEINGYKYKVGVSIGIAESNDHIKNSETLMKNSDIAMYKAKRKGGNQYFFL